MPPFKIAVPPPFYAWSPRWLAGCYFFALFVLGMVPAVLGPTLFTLATQTEATLGDISILFSMRSLGYLCCARFAGGLYDKRKGHPIMSTALGVTVILLFLIPYISSLTLLSGVFFFHGILSAFVDLGSNILLIWAFHKNTGPYLNGLHFSFGLGAVTAPLLVAFCLNAGQSAVFAYWIIGLLSIPGVLWIYQLASPQNPYEQVKQTPETKKSSAPVWLLVTFFFLYGGTEVSLGGWIHTYGIKHNLMHETRAAYLTSAFWGAFTMGRLLAIPLTTWFSAKRLIHTQLSGAVLFMLLLLTLPPGEPTTWICTIMVGCCMSSIFPLSLAYFEKFTAGSGQLTSWFWVGASAGSMTIPWLIGQFFEKIGPSFFTAVILAGISLAALIMFYIPWRWSTT